MSDGDEKWSRGEYVIIQAPVMPDDEYIAQQMLDISRCCFPQFLLARSRSWVYDRLKTKADEDGKQ